MCRPDAFRLSHTDFPLLQYIFRVKPVNCPTCPTKDYPSPDLVESFPGLQADTLYNVTISGAKPPPGAARAAPGVCCGLSCRSTCLGVLQVGVSDGQQGLSRATPKGFGLQQLALLTSPAGVVQNNVQTPGCNSLTFRTPPLVLTVRLTRAVAATTACKNTAAVSAAGFSGPATSAAIAPSAFTKASWERLTRRGICLAWRRADMQRARRSGATPQLPTAFCWCTVLLRSCLAFSACP